MIFRGAGIKDLLETFIYCHPKFFSTLTDLKLFDSFCFFFLLDFQVLKRPVKFFDPLIIDATKW